MMSLDIVFSDAVPLESSLRIESGGKSAFWLGSLFSPRYLYLAGLSGLRSLLTIIFGGQPSSPNA